MVARAGIGSRVVLVCLAAAWIAAGGGIRGAGTSPGSLSEYRIEAAYLYYFSTYVEWPTEKFSRGGDTLVIGVLGEDPFGDLLDETIRGKTVNNRRLIVKRMDGLKEARECHILFISSSEQGRLPLVLKALEGATVLTVGDIEQFASRGGQIGFRMEDKRVRFDINVSAVERARLKISSQLMKLGRIVRETGREAG